MAQTVAPEYAQFIAAERRAQRLDATAHAMAEGQVTKSVVVEAGKAAELLRVAARRAAGLFRPGKHTEVVWVEGDSELAVSLATLDVKFGAGLVRVLIPVRCDQVGAANIEVVFACGSADQPAGLYAATPRRPNGPELIIATWGDALVAYAWQCVLGLVTGLAGATGKDERGNVLVPVELAASARGLEIVPMARHRFAGSSGLKPATNKVRR